MHESTRCGIGVILRLVGTADALRSRTLDVTVICAGCAPTTCQVPQMVGAAVANVKPLGRHRVDHTRAIGARGGYHSESRRPYFTIC